MSAPAVVLVTGGTGFLGSAIARRLAARGDQLHVLARASSDRSVLDGLDARWHAGDLADAATVQAAVAAAARAASKASRPLRIVHCGALISYRTQDRAAQQAANVEGTRALLAAARNERAARFLHVSSVVAVGHGRGTETLDETIEWNNGPLGCDYATTKRQAEELALAAARDLDVVVANPGAIFGAWSGHSNTAKFLRLAAAGKGPLVAPPGSIGVLGIDDAADGCLLVLDRGRRGERYLLVESWITSRDLFRLVGRLVGGRSPLATLPRPLWPLVLLAARVLDRIRPLDLAPPQALAMLAVELRFDARKARSELGWRPAPFEEVLVRTITGLGLPLAAGGNGLLTASREPPH
ncbi:MAG: NAD-dependent epimerase/dehydratase family protein [Planctomycetes bacterium]|nr:NAD-dependent epimerase/dehydratase family protein [Planctomycetota bacterium]